MTFEYAPQAQLLQQGAEGDSFWHALGGKGVVAPKLSKYDKEYGVGTSPLLTPPEIQLPLPMPSAHPANTRGVETYEGKPVPRVSEPLPTPRGGRQRVDGEEERKEPVPKKAKDQALPEFRESQLAELYSFPDEGGW